MTTKTIRATIAALALVAAAAVVLVAAGRSSEDGTGSSCRQLSTIVALEHAREVGGAEAAGEAADAESGSGSGESEATQERAKLELAADCGIKVPESFQELSAANQALSPRIGIDSLRDIAATSRLRERSLRRHKVIRGRWKPLGEGPLLADDPKYPKTYGSGFAELAGASPTTPMAPRHAAVRLGRERRGLDCPGTRANWHRSGTGCRRRRSGRSPTPPRTAGR